MNHVNTNLKLDDTVIIDKDIMYAGGVIGKIIELHSNAVSVKSKDDGKVFIVRIESVKLWN